MIKEMQLKYAKFEDQRVDIFTKPFKFKYFRRVNMLVRVTNQVQGACVKVKLVLETFKILELDLVFKMYERIFYFE